MSSVTGTSDCCAGKDSARMGESTVTGAGVLTGSIAVNCGWAVGGVLLPDIFQVSPRTAKTASAAIWTLG
ncbi:hypothetical protein K7961_004681 [Salmonella enterica]|nr:hypothetical protein [Salmonella enterica subsp. enterica serovar Muenchen]EFT3364813.1 hypothetical protein [Salmonella enterica]EGN2788995.1 hypothetical protein [Salmonella enterica]EIB1513537.1 hypothetical protein [Salmonella enterica]